MMTLLNMHSSALKISSSVFFCPLQRETGVHRPGDEQTSLRGFEYLCAAVGGRDLMKGGDR